MRYVRHTIIAQHVGRKSRVVDVRTRLSGYIPSEDSLCREDRVYLNGRVDQVHALRVHLAKLGADKRKLAQEHIDREMLGPTNIGDEIRALREALEYVGQPGPPF